MTNVTIQVIPKKNWKTMPIQPAAGLYRRTIALGTPVLFTLVIASISVAIMARSMPSPPWYFYALMGLMLATGTAMALVAALAMRPYREERKRGYTTWPSAEELKQ